MPRDADDPNLIVAEGLSIRRGGHLIVDKVDLAVAPGEIVILIGPNGSGKTTLVRAILELMEPDAGRVTRRLSLTIGYVPQVLQIDPTLPLTVRRFLTLGTRASPKDLDAALTEVGVPQLLDQPVQSLSGGQLRRVLLARALLRDPDLLVLDEPTAGVDVSGQAALYDLIKSIRDRRGCGVLLVSHHLHLVMAAADRVVCLNHHVCCEGQPELVSRNPAYLDLFGEAGTAAIAVYTHQHDHNHDLTGAPVSAEDEHSHG
ncbi:MAG: ATP-binding cassette domain-containing protein [Rhodospirillaceae bacterium]|nr:ATP-binding cassette domain-containing protein [Rhodospirillaceae bacterium]MBT5457282.1 ATP-binding cassette domain-containing protein [Rhodospirillaceae bacterium]